MQTWNEQTRTIWVTLAPLVLINLIALSTVPIFAYFRKKNPSATDSIGEVKKRHHSKFLSLWFKEYWYWITSPIEKLALAVGLTPNFFTTLGFFISALAGYFFYRGYWGMAGWTLIIGGSCDLMDGRVARATGHTSVSGAFYDSVMDRYGELVCFAGLAGYYRNHFMFWVVLAAITGSMMVSYTRARGQAAGVDCDKGPMQRPERIVYLAVGSIFSPMMAYLLSPWGSLPSEFLTMLALILIAVMTNLTALYRLLWVYKRLPAAKVHSS